MKKPTDEAPDLIEILRPDQIDPVSRIHLCALPQLEDIEHHDGQLLTKLRALAYSAGHGKRLNGIESQTQQNQVGRMKPGNENRILLIAGCVYFITAGCEQPLDSKSSLLYIVNNENCATPLPVRCHG
jgi:hypothetical protein